MVIKRFLFICLACLAFQLKAQVHCFVQAQMDRRSMYVQQPFKVTYTVVTETWFTEPVEWDNLQIPNAFIIPFDRTIPGMFDINGKRYPGIQFHFIVFPYKPGRFILPAIKVVATTPPVGGYVAQRVTVRTQQLSYVVRPLPASFSAGNRLVAKDVAITQSWDKPLRNLKIGDVLQRTIVIDAKGTLPQFLPELQKDSLNWAGVYPGKATLEDRRDENDANGRRVETVTYLLQQEGNFTIPAVTLNCWNPVSSRRYVRGLGAIHIHVGPNSNLGMLKTLQDSLKGTHPVSEKPREKGPHLIYGIPWYWFALYSLAALSVLYIVIRVILRTYSFFRRKYAAYRSGEKYWFSRFKKSPLALPPMLKNLYQWWDRFKPGKKSPSILKETENDTDTLVGTDLESYYKNFYAGSNDDVKADRDFKKQVTLYREKIRKQQRSHENKISENQQLWDAER